MCKTIKSHPKTFGCLVPILAFVAFGIWQWVDFQDSIRPGERLFSVENNITEPMPDDCFPPSPEENERCRELRRERSAIMWDIANAVMYSLAHNRIDEQKQYLDENLWAFADTWMVTHKAVSEECTFPWDPDIRSYGVGGSHTVSQTFNYECPEERYSLRLTLHFIDKDGKLIVNSIEGLDEDRRR